MVALPLRRVYFLVWKHVDRLLILTVNLLASPICTLITFTFSFHIPIYHGVSVIFFPSNISFCNCKGQLGALGSRCWPPQLNSLRHKFRWTWVRFVLLQVAHVRYTGRKRRYLHCGSVSRYIDVTVLIRVSGVHSKRVMRSRRAEQCATRLLEALSKTLLLKDLLLAPSVVLALLPFDCHCSVLGSAIEVESCPSLLRCPIHPSYNQSWQHNHNSHMQRDFALFGWSTKKIRTNTHT